MLITFSFSFKISNLPTNKKFISIAPAGIYGSYTLGISSFIKDNYNLKDYVFIGASSGSWNSLICCYKDNHNILIKDLLKQSFFERSSINNLQENLYKYFSNNYKTDDFDLTKLYISVTEYEKCKFKNSIISDFSSLDEALECCRGSCHIPFLTSDRLIRKFKDKIVFDGGFTNFPPKNIMNNFIISANKFNKDNIQEAFRGLITKNFSTSIINDLFQKGYNDSIQNKKEIDLYINNNMPFYMNLI